MSLSDYEKTSTPNMVIDKTSGAVINTDLGGYAAIKAARDAKRKNAELVTKVAELTETVRLLSDRVDELSSNITRLRGDY
jgi:hypothetical protein